MATEEKKNIMEVRAFARGIHMSPRKVRLVANLIKDMPVDEAIVNLELATRKASKFLKKLVASGIANAKHNFQIEEGRLFIKSLVVDAGTVMKRFKPRAQGRAFPIHRRASNINLVLGVWEKARVVKRKVVTSTPTKTKGEKPPEASKASESRKSRFSFLRAQKDTDPTQVPPKQDVKGKHYTSFDRRGGE